uniref:Uncharacterized protein n=1 Tax=Aegilops tauschii subsp. strangulata TaxID=200361 RepID=A0A452Z5V3_AEGTS
GLPSVRELQKKMHIQMRFQGHCKPRSKQLPKAKAPLTAAGNTQLAELVERVKHHPWSSPRCSCFCPSSSPASSTSGRRTAGSMRGASLRLLAARPSSATCTRW